MYENKHKYIKTPEEQHTELVLSHRTAVDSDAEEIISMKEILLLRTEEDFVDIDKIVIPESWETDLKNGRIFFGHCEIQLPKNVFFSPNALEKGYDKTSQKPAHKAGLYSFFGGNFIEGCPASKKVSNISNLIKGLLEGTCTATDRLTLSRQFRKHQDGQISSREQKVL